MEKVNRYLEQRYRGVTGIMNKVDTRVYHSFAEMMRAYNATQSEERQKQFAVAAIVINPRDEKRFLAVKRPPRAKSLPNVWGLPAITLRYNEKAEIAAARLAREKLDTYIDFVGCIGMRIVDRGDHELTLMDVVVTLAGREPSVWKALTQQTKYVDQQWTDDLSLLQEAALQGSACSRILLDVQGFTYEQ